MQFHNANADLNKLFYNSHKNLIIKICDELEIHEKVDELVEKFLNNAFLKVKQMKDPDKPKKPKSSYMFFADDVRARLKSENPDAKMPELSKLIGAEWKKLSDEDKEKYVDMVNEAKAQVS